MSSPSSASKENAGGAAVTPLAGTVQVPDVWPLHYRSEDQQRVREILAWLAESSEEPRTIADLARRANLNRGTLSQCLAGKYPSAPYEHLRAAWEAVLASQDRQGEVRTVPYVQGSMYRMMSVSVRRARTYRSVTVLTGAVGTGKTSAARAVAAAVPGVVLLEAHGEMSTAGVLGRLCRAAGLKVPVWAPPEDKVEALIEAWQGSETVVVVDEAETLVPAHRAAKGRRTLEVLRRLRDLAQIGMVFVGTDKMDDVIGKGHFDQLRSRVIARPEHVRTITRDDADAVVRAALPDQAHVLGDEVLDAFWRGCAGSMRVLVEGLIPGVRLYGIDKGIGLDAKLVRAVAQQALGLGGGK